MKWRLALVMSCVVVLHAAGVWWWTASRGGSGQAGWSSSHGLPFRVRATVLQEVAVVPMVPDAIQAPPVESRQAEPDQAVALLQTALTAAPSAAAKVVGSNPVWSPIPSDYLSDEQVDVFPRPKDEWMLDWPQVPLTRGAWRATVRMWVSATGLVDHVETLDAQPPEAWVARLLAPLATTEMEPATLAGQPVPVTYVVQLAPDQLQ